MEDGFQCGSFPLRMHCLHGLPCGPLTSKTSGVSLWTFLVWSTEPPAVPDSREVNARSILQILAVGCYHRSRNERFRLRGRAFIKHTDST